MHSFLEKIKKKLSYHFHVWDYPTYLHRKCILCSAKEKRKAPWFFKGTNLIAFEKSWHPYRVTDDEFKKETEQFAANLKKCFIHNSQAEKTRFGIWKIYNECAIRQNRAFPHYGVSIIININGETA